MPGLPSVVKDVPSQRNFDALRAEDESLDERLDTIEKEGLPPSGEAGGVVKGPFKELVFAEDMATQGELNAEKSSRESEDATEKSARESADTAIKAEVKTEKESRESADATLTAADATEKAARLAADEAEQLSRETGDGERVRGPTVVAFGLGSEKLGEGTGLFGEGFVTDQDIATWDGTSGRLVKDSGKTIAAVLLEAEETARTLATAAAAGLSIKQPVTYATTASLTVTTSTAKTLEGTCPVEVDGNPAPQVGTRLLVKDQSSKKFRNGVYEVTKNECFGGEGKFGEGEAKFGEGSKWKLTRTSDADEESEVKQGMFILVTQGTTNANTTWILTTENPIVVGTTEQIFAAFTAQPVGSAGGDLTGTYPNPTIKEGAVGTAELEDGAIVNADVNVSAAIAYSKLALATSIVNGDIAAAAEIAYSKLKLAASIAAGDLATSAKQLFPQLAASATRVLLAGQVSAAGAVVRGEGFTSEKTAAGKYTVKFNSELASVPVVTAVAVSTFGHMTIAEETKSQFKIITGNAAGVEGDHAFNFMVLG